MARRAAPLSKERVLKAALALVDKDGIDALSMRKLAQQLGVEAMSLYNHVANKKEIVDGILGLVAAEIDPPADGADWKQALRDSAISAHEALLRHRWAARTWRSGGSDSRGMQHADAVLRTFREAGFSKDLTYHAYHTLEGYVFGVTLQQVNFPFDAARLKQMASKFLREFPADEYPHLAEHVEQHLEPHEHEQGSFELGLDLILDGFERLRDGRG